MLGTSDIQSLADLGNAYNMVREMRVVPFSNQAIVRLAVIIALPLAPLALTMAPLERIIDGLIKLAL